MTLTCTMILGDCLEVMPSLPKKSVNKVFCDLPYGVTAEKWDRRICLRSFWAGALTCCTPNFAASFTATQPFATSLINSQPRLFKYDLVWNKNRSTNFFQAKLRPLRTHETMLVFARGKPAYNPQLLPPNGANSRVEKGEKVSRHYGIRHKSGTQRGRPDNLRYPISILFFPRNLLGSKGHPNQKPLDLLKWVVQTYSNPGDMVLDPVSGSGTTAVAASLCGRSSVCIEKDPGYFEASVERVRKTVTDGKLDVSIEVRR